MATKAQLKKEKIKKNARPLNENMVNNVLTKNKGSKDKRTRKFCLTTYLPDTCLYGFLSNCKWVQHFAYCTHDKDVVEDGTPKEKHTHILLYTYDGKTSSAVKKIFDNYSIEVAKIYGGKAQNTLAQVCNDMNAQYRYLRHLDDPHKFQYSLDEVVADDLPYWNNLSNTQGMTDCTKNAGLAIFDDYANGVDTYTMIQRYGKEFIYHLSHYEKAMQRLMLEQRKSTFNSFRDICAFALADSTFTDKEVKSFLVMLDYIQLQFANGTEAFAEDTYRFLKG